MFFIPKTVNYKHFNSEIEVLFFATFIHISVDAPYVFHKLQYLHLIIKLLSVLLMDPNLLIIYQVSLSRFIFSFPDT